MRMMGGEGLQPRDRDRDHIMNLFLAFPHLPLVLSLTPILQSRLRARRWGEGSFLPMASLVIILGFFGWAYLARIVRGQVLSLRSANSLKRPAPSGPRTSAFCSGRSSPMSWESSWYTPPC